MGTEGVCVECMYVCVRVRVFWKLYLCRTHVSMSAFLGEVNVSVFREYVCISVRMSMCEHKLLDCVCACMNVCMHRCV